MNIFFADDISSDMVTLGAEESNHCCRVMRHKVGDVIGVTDGCGSLCRAEIVTADPKGCVVGVIERREHYAERPFRLHLAVAPTKNNARLEWLVEKAVEIGIDEITPVICAHSERVTVNDERLWKVAVSAMKQSQKAQLPTLNAPTAFDALLARVCSSGDDLLLCHCDGERKRLGEVYRMGHNATVLIGPEGDFSTDEIDKALEAGFLPVTLGNTRLRTETAALFALSAINFING